MPKPTRTKASRRQSPRGNSARRRRYVLLDGTNTWRDRLGRKQTAVYSGRGSLVKAVGESSRDTLWISSSPQRTEELLQAISTFLASHHASRQRFGSIFMLESPRQQVLPTLLACFDAVFGEVPSFKTLPMDQLVEVLSSPEEKSKDVFVGGSVDRVTGTLTLVRGNLERLIVPLTLFRPSGRHSPDFRRFELDDYGQTLRFGEYEATADVVLWEMDADYRKRAKARERAHAAGFGPALRRLRKQRGLAQSDFPGVSRKTIARLEKGEVDKPHGRTLNRIAQALGVPSDQIETY